jgi:hypothetical protein
MSTGRTETNRKPRTPNAIAMAGYTLLADGGSTSSAEV